MGKLAKVRGEGGEGVSQSSASLRLIELRLEAWQQAAILSDTGGNVNDVNDATGARVFQNKLINCLVAPTNFTTHPGPEVRPHIWYVSRKRLYFGPTMYKVKVQQMLAVSVIFVKTVFSHLISVYLHCSTS